MRVLKIVGGIVGVVLLAIGSFIAYVAASGIPSYPVPKIELKVAATPERIAKGKLLAGMLCAECHRDPATQALTGRELTDLPRQFGRAWSQNITQDQTDGIGSWTDAELAVTIRTGIHRDGSYLPPWMVKLPYISDEDLASVIAFIRSDDPVVAPKKGRQPHGQPTLLLKFLTHLAFKPLPLPTAPIAAPKFAYADGKSEAPKGAEASVDEQIAFGRYLSTSVLGCYECHSKDFATNDRVTPEKSAGFFGGGNAMPDINQRMISTANLTPDQETGIGNWSEADFRRALQKGFRPDHRPVRPPMPRLQQLSDAWADAIFAYLKTVPPIHNAVPRDDSLQLGPNASAGEHAYAAYSCASCHGLSGEGTCDMRGAGKKYKTDEEMIAWIRDAPKLKPGTAMPTWDGVIAEADYKPLAEYVRVLGKRWEDQSEVATSR